MQATWNDNELTITADAEEQALLRQLREEDSDAFGTNGFMIDCLESLIANSELDWINPSETGDLTDAPMLGIFGEETTENAGPFGARQVGFWDGQARYSPVLNRWGFMDYHMRSPMEDLAENGKAVFRLVCNSGNC